MATGRSTEARAVTVTTTSGSAAITAAAGTFEEEDVGRSITAASGIPAGTTIVAVASDTAATMSANASATGSRTATLGAAAGTAYGFHGWSPETDAESETYSIAGGASASSPDRITNQFTPRQQRGRG